MGSEPATTGTTEPPSISDTGQAISAVVNTAPELKQSPGLAMGVATSGGDVEARAQAVAHATNTISASNAHTAVQAGTGDDLDHALSWFGNHVVAPAAHVAGEAIDVLPQPIKTAGADVMNVLNKPMQLAQREYRYLHQVEAMHGKVAAVLEGLGMAAGAAGGVALGGGIYGAELGAEGAVGIESQLFYHQAWNQVANPTYTDPHTGQPVSMGRDIASVLGLRPGTTGYKLSSGLIDGIFDMNLGGPEALGLVTKAKSAEGLSRLLGTRWGGTMPRTVGDLVDGHGVIQPDEIDRITRQYPSVRRAFQDIADKDLGGIVATPAYAAFRDIYSELANAHSIDEVGQVFKEVLRTQELAFTDRLPSLSWTRQKFGQNFRELVEEAQPLQGNEANAVRRLFSPGTWAARETPLPTAWDDAKKVTVRSVDPMNPLDDGTHGLYNMIRYSESRSVAASVAAAFHNAPDLASKIQIFRNATMNTIFAMSKMRGYMNVDMTLAPDVEGYLRDVFADPRDRQAMSDAFDNAFGGAMFGHDAVYGIGRKGVSISKVRDLNSAWEYGAGIWDNQTGRIKFIDISDARFAAARIAGAKTLFKNLDSIGYNAITQGVFKPIVLLTGSYAEHIALAEIIPNVLREGLTKSLRQALLEQWAKIGVKIGDIPGTITEDLAKQMTHDRFLSTNWNLPRYRRVLQAVATKVDAVEALAYHVVRSTMDHAPLGMDAKFNARVQLAAKNIDFLGGEMVSPEASSMHAFEHEVDHQEAVQSILRKSLRSSPLKGDGTYARISADGDEGTVAWYKALDEPRRDADGRDLAAQLSADTKSGMDVNTAMTRARVQLAAKMREAGADGKMLRQNENITSFPKGVDRPPDMDQFDEHAKAKIDALVGLVEGRDGTLHTNILDALAENTRPPIDDLKAIPEESRPAEVKGQNMLPVADGRLQRIANVGFHKVLNPIVNFLSRQPIYWNEFERQYNALEHLASDGIVDEEQRLILANTRASTRVMRNVHNLEDRTQLTATLRNWAPFYFAQEQAYRRMGRLLAENPRAFRQYQLMISNIGNVGDIFTGKDSNNYFVMPGTGWIDPGITAILGPLFGTSIQKGSPIGVGWNLSASSVIFPLSAGARPDLGPLMAIPTQVLTDLLGTWLPTPALKQDMTAAQSLVLGPDAAQSVWSNLIPNTIVQRLVTAMAPGIDERSFDSTSMQVLQTLYYENKVPAPNAGPMAMQAFLERWRSQTQIAYIVKAIVGAVTPVSPEIQIQNFGLPADLQADINSEGSLTAGMAKFLAAHPDAQAYTTFQSEDPLGVSGIPASTAAEKWIDENWGVIQQSKGAALMLLPVDTNSTYNANVYNAQMLQGIREKWSPGNVLPTGELSGYLQQLYINAGNAIVYGKWYPAFDKQIAGLTGEAKYVAEQNFYTTTLTKYAQQNPVWGEYFNPNGTDSVRESQRGQNILNMKALLASPQAPKTILADQTRQLIDAYEAYQTQLNSDTADGTSSTSITDTWKANLIDTMTEYPSLVNVISNLFMSLPSAPSTTTTAPGSTETPGIFNAAGWNHA